ncbi:MAG TPA: hypothetical protein P5294_07030, partial [Smithellaceae bacterium]|nr:hypothetical protein [Smithellaceae bacterium]HRS88933.1 hypothetical protein [Smithellaceae bacterium]HRV26272.1 hypothetical protein [Smithellaceae bacterium]
MNKFIAKIMSAMIIMAVVLCVTAGKAPSQESSAATDKKDTATIVVKNLENILFETLPGKERVVLVVSQPPAIKAEGQTNGSLLIKLEDTIAAEPLLKGLGEGQLSNILRVTPSGHKINGKQWVHLLIDIRNLVPYSIKQEGKNIFVDFNVAGLPARKTPIAASATGTDKSFVSAPITKTQQKAPEEAKAKKEEIVYSSTETRMLDRRISIDFQDADIKSVLRLMAEYGNV